MGSLGTFTILSSPVTLMLLGYWKSYLKFESIRNLIDGGLGADEISTGNGNDTVVIRQGDGGNTIVEADMISDFTDGSDLIGLHNLEFSDLTIVQGSGDYVNDALVSSGSEYLVLIEDIDVADLTVADFVVFDIV